MLSQEETKRLLTTESQEGQLAEKSDKCNFTLRNACHRSCISLDSLSDDILRKILEQGILNWKSYVAISNTSRRFRTFMQNGFRLPTSTLSQFSVYDFIVPKVEYQNSCSSDCIASKRKRKVIIPSLVSDLSERSQHVDEYTYLVSVYIKSKLLSYNQMNADAAIRILEKAAKYPSMSKIRRDFRKIKLKKLETCSSPKHFVSLAAYICLDLATLLYNHHYQYPDFDYIKSLLEYALLSDSLRSNDKAHASATFAFILVDQPKDPVKYHTQRSEIIQALSDASDLGCAAAQQELAFLLRTGQY